MLYFGYCPMIMQHNLIFVNGYTCSNDCEISDDSVNNGYCDCYDCGDEDSWTCGSCGGCPNATECGSSFDCPPIDYYFYPVASNDTYNDDMYDIREFGCTFPGCSVTKSWLIDGQCDNPLLIVQIVETDFQDSPYEYAQIYINNDYIGKCDELDSDCTYNWVTCLDVNGYNLTDYLYLPSEDSSDTISITVKIPVNVNICPYQSYYDLWARVIISCFDFDITSDDSDNSDSDDANNNQGILPKF